MAFPTEWESVARAKGLMADTAPLPTFVTLPKVPTSNNLFLTARRGRKIIREKTPEYRDWIVRASPAMMRLQPPELPARYKITIVGKMRSNADGANLEKAVLDLAVSCGVIPDDSLKYLVSGNWSYEPVPGIEDGTVRFEFV